MRDEREYRDEKMEMSPATISAVAGTCRNAGFWASENIGGTLRELDLCDLMLAKTKGFTYLWEKGCKQYFNI